MGKEAVDIRTSSVKTGRPTHFNYAVKSGVANDNPAKIGKVMHEFKRGELHSGSKTGPRVKSRRQAVAIAMSEAGMSRKKKKKGY